MFAVLQGHVSTGLKLQAFALIVVGIVILIIGPVFALQDALSAPIERSASHHHIPKNATIDIAGVKIEAHPNAMKSIQKEKKTKALISQVAALSSKQSVSKHAVEGLGVAKDSLHVHGKGIKAQLPGRFARAHVEDLGI